MTSDGARGRSLSCPVEAEEVGSTPARVRDPVLDDLERAYLGGNLVVFAGHGVSTAAGLPSRERLLGLIVERARARGAEGELCREIQTLADQRRVMDALTAVKDTVSANEFCATIERHLDDQGFEVPDIASAIAALSPRAVLTTSLDLLLERAFLGRWPALARATGNIAQRHRFILKLFGTLLDRSTWVLTRDEHDRVTHHDPHLVRAFSALFASCPLLFVGCDPAADYFQAVLGWVRFLASEQPPNHFALVHTGALTRYLRNELDRLGVRPIAYEDRDGTHVEAVQILRNLRAMRAGETPLDRRASQRNVFEQTLSVAQRVPGGTTVQERSPSHLATIVPEAHLEDASHIEEFNPAPASICPFPGLEFFDEDLADLFFGRDAEINEALQRLGETGDAHRRWLQIDGPSGAGKSSLARAGLVPRVRQGGWIAGSPQRFRTGVFRPGLQPVRALATALRYALEDRLPPGLRSAEALALELDTSDLALTRLLRKHSGDEGFLLVVDQLEEALTLSALEARDRLDRLLAQALLDPGGPLYLVTTIRSDFEAALSVLPELSALLNAHASRYHLRPISAPGLRAAIAGPAQHVGLRWERGLAERLIEDAAATDTSLPLVAHVLHALWTKRDGDLLTHATYDALGGLSGALARSVDPVIERLGAEGSERARRLLLRLVKIGRGAEDTRQTASRAEVLEAAGSDEYAEHLLLRLSGGREPGTADGGAGASVRLVVVSRRDGEDRVDLVHEALLKRWATLRHWIEASRKALERRDDLEAAAKVWEAAGGHEDGLPGGAQLAYLREAEAPGPRARRFLELATALETRRAAERETARLRLEEERNEAQRQRESAERRLADAIELADEVHLAIERDLKYIAGTAAIRRKLLSRTAALLDRAGESSDALHSRMVNHRQRGELALTHDGDLTLAKKEYDAALAINLRLVELVGNNAQYKSELPIAYGKLGEVAHVGGDLAQARGCYEKCLALMMALLTAEPISVRPQRDDLSMVYAKLGALEQESGDLEAARNYFEDAQEQLEALTGAEPKNVNAWRDLSRIFHMLGDVAHLEGDFASAREYHERALELATALSKSEPQNSILRRDLLVSHNKVGDMALTRSDLALARDHYERSLELTRSLLESYPQSLEWQFDLAHVYIRMASWASQSNEATTLRQYRDAGASILDRLERSGRVQGLAVFYELRTALDLLKI